MNAVAREKWLLFSKGLERLKEGLDKKGSHEDWVDVVVKRFEFCFGLCWKTLKFTLKFDGDHELLESPGAVLRYCTENGLVQNRSMAKRMLADRNQAAHVYDYDKALQIAERVPDYYVLMCEIRDRLQPILCNEERD